MGSSREQSVPERLHCARRPRGAQAPGADGDLRAGGTGSRRPVLRGQDAIVVLGQVAPRVLPLVFLIVWLALLIAGR